MRHNDEAGGLARRRFVQLSGIAGAGAILAGAGPLAGHNPAAAAQPLPVAPNPVLCGSDSDPDPLWQRARACHLHTQSCPQTEPDYVVLAGTNTHNFLLVPTVRRKGIECPSICDANAPNYWAAARRLAGVLPTVVTPPSGSVVGYGINSADPGARQFQQLHIHMAAVRRESLNDLVTHDSDATRTVGNWSRTNVSVRGYSATQMMIIPHVYRVLIRRDFSNVNLFALLRNMVGQTEMGHQTLIVVPRPQNLGGGYYIVNSQASLMYGNLVGSNTCDPLLLLS